MLCRIHAWEKFRKLTTWYEPGHGNAAGGRASSVFSAAHLTGGTPDRQQPVSQDQKAPQERPGGKPPGNMQ
ncbi:hypothetical protein CSA56_14750 [candidate division KSB3 bacterium]|uniref:Uncharacterized protein n=1 Tax=candidate division KSB3 bacterium TaxID=2044937 RepID=A0A2G6KCW5_9BACT|nr:MAG: hypothetical protein CSA56_14750 [candidate division KSB3 bacterium]